MSQGENGAERETASTTDANSEVSSWLSPGRVGDQEQIREGYSPADETAQPGVLPDGPAGVSSSHPEIISTVSDTTRGTPGTSSTSSTGGSGMETG
ncbi:hypothetical protein [Streptomyces sp. NPDC058304]|uniref:hypothetical protein n=1 Tax=Streptomyces sp. NPDC058304 TaxID=3346437 RepID=UPI0036E60465